jgi:hypothetical protein
MRAGEALRAGLKICERCRLARKLPAPFGIGNLWFFVAIYNSATKSVTWCTSTLGEFKSLNRSGREQLRSEHY